MPAETTGELIGNLPNGRFDKTPLTSALLGQNGELPSGSSEILHIEHQNGAWKVGFVGIPRIAVFLNVLSIMENNILPLYPGCRLDVVFNFLDDKQLLMTSVSNHYIPNGNTYSNVLYYLERNQDQCY
ncbi:hypothetical protein Q5H92_24645 [Hymenobacter sp. M29]|uniref:dUTPase-like domain-containing protein n=1 Tax=Hymenobacter mellowenesis TaxID=3063995 RepID=A0ABT9AJM6_9BACT|nr:hypothetical protein [Hymenobacter sp. M29]MDO7849574.1 hypothetical protein [Hymenobacter sp. M29]